MFKNKKLVGLLVCVSLLFCSIFVLTMNGSTASNTNKKEAEVASKEDKDNSIIKDDTQEEKTGQQDQKEVQESKETENKQNSSNTAKQNNSTNQKNNDTSKSPDNSQNQTTPNTPEDKYVTITIDCKTILNNMGALPEQYKGFVPSNGMIMPTKKVKLQEGDTVFDVVVRVAKQQNIQLSQSAGYIQSINNLTEKMFQGSGGWMYAVNGSYASTGSNSYTLKNNDRIEWRYTCYIGDIY